MHYVWDFGILSKYSHLFWLGLGFTLLYTIGTIFLGTLIGPSSACSGSGAFP